MLLAAMISAARLTSLLLLACVAISAQAANVPTPTYTDPAKTDADFPLQGEYVGTLRNEPFAIQVIAKGQALFDATLCPGGLPGAGWTGEPNPRQRLAGKREGEGAEARVRFAGNGWQAMLQNQAITLQDLAGVEIGLLRRSERASSTLGAAAPEGAKVLFDGSSVAAFKPGARIENELLCEGCTTQEEFGDCTIHLEFRLSYMPEAAGQGRSNSGLYIAGRYEVQVLDSFGLNGANNECGGLYSIAKPKANLCLPPLQWQTYDIDYTAPRFDAEGKKTAEAKLSVRHNGVLIHDQVSLPHTTTAAPIATEGPRGPLHLQNHGCPVRYRNFWVLPKTSK